MVHLHISVKEYFTWEEEVAKYGNRIDLGGLLRESNLTVFSKTEGMGDKDKACQSLVCHVLAD